MTKVKIIQTRSTIGKTVRQKRIIEALGLNGIGSSVSQVLSPSVQGMINRVGHLIEIIETK